MTSEESLKKNIVLKLARRHAWTGNPIPKDLLKALFSPDEADRVESAIEDLTTSESPVDESPGGIYISDQEFAVEYLSDYPDITLNSIIPHAKREGIGTESNTPNRNTESNTPNDVKEEMSNLRSEVEGLQKEIKNSDKTAKQWRKEAKRRQRLSILLSVITFILGIGATVAVQTIFA